jgi:hypothetical protein
MRGLVPARQRCFQRRTVNDACVAADKVSTILLSGFLARLNGDFEGDGMSANIWMVIDGNAATRFVNGAAPASAQTVGNVATT